MSSIWINKYLPKKLDEVIGQFNQVSLLKKYVEEHRKGGKIIFLYGGRGNGKTSSVYALANELNLELVELNASDTRNSAAIESIIGGAIGQMSLFGTKKLILIDEVEGISGTKDRGAIQSLLKTVKKSNYPVIVIGVDAYDKKVKAIRKESELIEFVSLDIDSIETILKNILNSEKIDYDNKAVRQLARISDGDARAAVNDLQTIVAGKKKLEVADVEVLGDRNSTKTIEDALQRVFKTTDSEIALHVFDEVSEDLDKIFLWVEENLPKEYLEPEALSSAFDNLSLANVFFGRIRRWQYYRFYVYCYNLLSAGIAISKDKKNDKRIEYKQSSRLLKIWIYNNANAKKKAIAQKVASHTHSSQKEAFHSVVPFLQVSFQNDSKKALAIADELDFSDEEIAWLKKKK